MTLLTTREALAKALQGHRLDTMSQDSGKHCTCGSDSRFEQRGGADPPWASMDEHRASVVLASGAVVDAATLADNEALVERAAAAIYDDGDEQEWLTTTDASPNSASYYYAQRALAALAEQKGSGS